MADLAALMRSTIKVPTTFGEFVMKTYNDIPNLYQVVYIACDTCRDVSIKSPERRLRGESNKLTIKGGKVRIPPDFQNFLCHVGYKERLFELLEEIWIMNRHMLVDRVVYIARGSICTRITNVDYGEVEDLKTDHEEADTKIAYLIHHVINTNTDAAEIIVRSCSGDIDIPVIPL